MWDMLVGVVVQRREGVGVGGVRVLCRGRAGGGRVWGFWRGRLMFLRRGVEGGDCGILSRPAGGLGVFFSFGHIVGKCKLRVRFGDVSG